MRRELRSKNQIGLEKELARFGALCTYKNPTAIVVQPKNADCTRARLADDFVSELINVGATLENLKKASCTDYDTCWSCFVAM